MAISRDEATKIPDRRSIDEAPGLLQDMLQTAGIDPRGTYPFRALWSVFPQFALVPFDTSDDGVIFQSGTYNFHGPDEYYLALDRQFEVLYPDGEHDHYVQLQCEFRYPPTDQTDEFGSFDRWWINDAEPDPWEDFARAVEERPEFRALADQAPAVVAITQGRV